MSPAQNSLYWRLWGRLARKHGLGKGMTMPGGFTLLAQVQEAAITIAASGDPTANHWRHACHIVAIGRASSSRDLGGIDFDRVIALFQALIDPSDLDAFERLHDPEIQHRRRLVFSANRLGFSEQYIDTVARRKFGEAYNAPYWEDLPMESLRQLVLTLSQAAKRRQAA